MTLPAPLAYISDSRAIVLIDRAGRTHDFSLGPETHLMLGRWQVSDPKAASFSWPTWSPNGEFLACFRLPSEELSSARVFAFHTDGVTSVELADLAQRLPIYLHWSPDSERVAVLSQNEDRLNLTAASMRDVGNEVVLAEGSPLFFTWAGADRVAAFVGDLQTSISRLSLLDPAGTKPSLQLPGVPGNFCAPLWIDDKVVYVMHEEGHTLVVTAGRDSEQPTHIEEVDGLVALVASPDGHTVARAVAPDGDGTPYRQIGLVDVRTNLVREVIDLSCLAYLWSPTGDFLVVARVDTDRNLLEWLRVDLDGRTEHLCDMYPTRDLGFYLRFFEQYTQSHPIIDPTGKSLLLAGTLAGHGDGNARPRLWSVSLDDGHAEELAEGLFAVYGPRGVGGR